ADRPLADSAAASEVVRQLDGLPLAIELAAAKLRSVSVTDLATGLRERLALLEDGPRDAPTRHRTLQMAIRWSYDLLTPAEQGVLRLLSVFPGSFEASAAEAVAGKESLAILARLVDASLVAADPPRFRLLVTVRTFGRERLVEHGEERQARQRHRDAFVALAESVGRNMCNAGLGPWLVRGQLEQENFLAALRWSLDRGDAGPAFALAAWLTLFWFRTGFVRDGMALLEEAMAGADPCDPHWPRALVGRACLTCASGLDALGATEDAVVAAERAGEDDLLALALGWRGYELLRRRQLSEARAHLVRAQALAMGTHDDEAIAFSDQMLGELAMAEGDLDAAANLLVRARDRYRRSRVTVDAGFTLVDLARVRLAQSRFSDALTIAGEALADFRHREDPRGVASALRCLSQAYAGLGQPDRARRTLAEACALVERWGFALHLSGQLDDQVG
ncbi:MAG: ATP-binding protein, partial [Actinomycetes bacterium]